ARGSRACARPPGRRRCRGHAERSAPSEICPRHLRPTTNDKEAMRTIHTPHAPDPRGHYSQAIVHNGTVYLAGQLASDPNDPDAPPPADPGEQTRLIFRNIARILEEAGSSLDRLLQVTIY